MPTRGNPVDGEAWWKVAYVICFSFLASIFGYFPFVVTERRYRHLRNCEDMYDTAVSYIGKRTTEVAVAAEREAIAQEARRYAAFYSEASDGRNPFILLAEWIESREPNAALSPQPSAAKAITFWYKNYKGEEGYRRVRPISIRYGTSEWHKKPGWLLLAYDVVNEKQREFSMKDIATPVGDIVLPIAASTDKVT